MLLGLKILQRFLVQSDLGLENPSALDSYGAGLGKLG